MRLVIGTRGSPLALAQTEIVRGLLERAHPGLCVDKKIIKTSGDQFANLSLAAGGGKGLFTKEIDEQLLRGDIDLAVHSLKDLPTELPVGLMIGAVPTREDARDVLILNARARPPGAPLPSALSTSSGAPGSRALPDLPARARVATSSIRRRAQLLARRPDLQVEEIRGNVETRLRKLAENPALDGLILAAAGLRRLGLWGAGFQMLAIEEMIPAVGQGAIGCEVRADDAPTRKMVTAINHPDTWTCVTAERAFLRAMGGGCQVPYAAHARVAGADLRLIAARLSPEGSDVHTTEERGPTSEPEELGRQAAAHLCRGAASARVE